MTERVLLCVAGMLVLQGTWGNSQDSQHLTSQKQDLFSFDSILKDIKRLEEVKLGNSPALTVGRSAGPAPAGIQQTNQQLAANGPKDSKHAANGKAAGGPESVIGFGRRSSQKESNAVLSNAQNPGGIHTENAPGAVQKQFVQSVPSVSSPHGGSLERAPSPASGTKPAEKANAGTDLSTRTAAAGSSAGQSSFSGGRASLVGKQGQETVSAQARSSAPTGPDLAKSAGPSGSDQARSAGSSGPYPANLAGPSSSDQTRSAAPSFQARWAGPSGSDQAKSAGPSSSDQARSANTFGSYQERLAGPSGSDQARPAGSEQARSAGPSYQTRLAGPSVQARLAGPSVPDQTRLAGPSGSDQTRSADPSVQARLAGPSGSDQTRSAGPSVQTRLAGPSSTDQARSAGSYGSDQTRSAGPSSSNQPSGSFQPASSDTETPARRSPSVPEIDIKTVPVEETNVELIPGRPGVDYPVLVSMPQSGFDCRNQPSDGFYADTSKESRCQTFWVCHNNQQDGFLCPKGTLFNQRYMTCDWWFNVHCDEAPQYFVLNKEIEVVGSGSQPHSSSPDAPVVTLLEDILQYPRVPPILPVVLEKSSSENDKLVSVSETVHSAAQPALPSHNQDLDDVTLNSAVEVKGGVPGTPPHETIIVAEPVIVDPPAKENIEMEIEFTPDKRHKTRRQAHLPAMNVIPRHRKRSLKNSRSHALHHRKTRDGGIAQEVTEFEIVESGNDPPVVESVDKVAFPLDVNGPNLPKVQEEFIVQQSGIDHKSTSVKDILPSRYPKPGSVKVIAGNAKSIEQGPVLVASQGSPANTAGSQFPDLPGSSSNPGGYAGLTLSENVQVEQSGSAPILEEKIEDQPIGEDNVAITVEDKSQNSPPNNPTYVIQSNGGGEAVVQGAQGDDQVRLSGYISEQNGVSQQTASVDTIGNQQDTDKRAVDEQVQINEQQPVSPIQSMAPSSQSEGTAVNQGSQMIRSSPEVVEEKADINVVVPEKTRQENEQISSGEKIIETIEPAPPPKTIVIENVNQETEAVAGEQAKIDAAAGTRTKEGSSEIVEQVDTKSEFTNRDGLQPETFQSDIRMEEHKLSNKPGVSDIQDPSALKEEMPSETVRSLQQYLEQQQDHTPPLGKIIPGRQNVQIKSESISRIIKNPSGRRSAISDPSGISLPDLLRPPSFGVGYFLGRGGHKPPPTQGPLVVPTPVPKGKPLTAQLQGSIDMKAKSGIATRSVNPETSIVVQEDRLPILSNVKSDDGTSKGQQLAADLSKKLPKILSKVDDILGPPPFKVKREYESSNRQNLVRGAWDPGPSDNRHRKRHSESEQQKGGPRINLNFVKNAPVKRALPVSFSSAIASENTDLGLGPDDLKIEESRAAKPRVKESADNTNMEVNKAADVSYDYEYSELPSWMKRTARELRDPTRKARNLLTSSGEKVKTTEGISKRISRSGQQINHFNHVPLKRNQMKRSFSDVKRIKPSQEELMNVLKGFEESPGSDLDRLVEKAARQPVISVRSQLDKLASSEDF